MINCILKWVANDISYNAGNVDTLILYTKPLSTGPAYTVNYNFGYDNLDRLTSAARSLPI